jgi:beta-glucosidase
MLTMSRRSLIAAAIGPFALRKPLRAQTAAAEQVAFPADFVWGASTSSYQIEGAIDEDGRGKSIWDIFCRSPGRIKNGDTGDVACDHYHRWTEDVDWLAGGGFDAYRFSTAWPRILPAGGGAVEHRGLDFYDRLVDRLITRGITPWLCLYHWDLPQALQDRGGWLERDIGERFADYARVVATRLGDRVKHWAMFNEPNIHALFGHGVGNHAPGLTGLPNMLAAIHHQNLAQGRALQALRAERSDLRLGTVLSLQPARPCTERREDRDAAERFDAMWNGACLEPLLQGSYPAAVAADFAPLIAPGDLAAMRQPIDYLGVNYYSPLYVAAAPQSLFGAWFGSLPDGMPVTAMGWPIDAGGLYDELVALHGRYGDLELYLTENGACFDDHAESDGTVHDDERIGYLRQHLAAAHRALAAGVKLRGYFVWSLLDNFEWAEGYSRRFGVIGVDFATQVRSPKASYRWLAELIAAQKAGRTP